MNLHDFVKIDLIQIHNDILGKLMDEIKDNVPKDIKMYVDDCSLYIEFGTRQATQYTWAIITLEMKLEFSEGCGEYATSINFNMQYPGIRNGSMRFRNESLGTTEQLIEILEEVDRDRKIWDRS